MQVSYAQPVASRRFDFKRWLGIPLGLMALLLVVDPQPLDFALAGLFYDPASGFIGSSSFWLEDVLHDQAKILVIGLSTLR